jgi:predicted RNA-binding Zn-ribbon protein involved in translation (DUF1610 family)
MLSCPQCGVERIKRSRARGIERLIRTFSSYRIYRCPDCKWRGWLATGESPWGGIFKKTVRMILVFAIVILTAITAWLITRALS